MNCNFFWLCYLIVPRPATKKSVESAQKQINDFKKKESDHLKNAIELQKQYEKSCAAQKISVSRH